MQARSQTEVRDCPSIIADDSGKSLCKRGHRQHRQATRFSPSRPRTDNRSFLLRLGLGLRLIRRELAPRVQLLVRLLIRLGKSGCPGPGLLPLSLIQLAGRDSHLLGHECLPVVRSTQERIAIFHHRAVDELPLVVSFFLVENPDRRVLALAGYADDSSPSEGLPADSGIAKDWVVVAPLAWRILALPSARRRVLSGAGRHAET